MAWHKISSSNLIYDGAASGGNVDCTTNTSAGATGVPTRTSMVTLQVENTSGAAGTWSSAAGSRSSLYLAAGALGSMNGLTDSDGAVSLSRPQSCEVRVTGYLDTSAQYSEYAGGGSSQLQGNMSMNLTAKDQNGDDLTVGGMGFFLTNVTIQQAYEALECVVGLYPLDVGDDGSPAGNHDQKLGTNNQGSTGSSTGWVRLTASIAADGSIGGAAWANWNDPPPVD